MWLLCVYANDDAICVCLLHFGYIFNLHTYYMYTTIAQSQVKGARFYDKYPNPIIIGYSIFKSS